MKITSVTLNWNNAKIDGIGPKAIRGMIRMGYDIANQARRNAPYQTGALSDSIRVEENAGVVEVIAGGIYGGKTIPYAAIQEFGGYAGRNLTAYIPAKQYMQRAMDAVLSGNYLEKYFGELL